MTDEKLIKILYGIKDGCQAQGTECLNCPFAIKKYMKPTYFSVNEHCALVMLVRKLHMAPRGWNMIEIKQILKDLGEQNETVG